MNKNLLQKFLNRACYDEQDQRELEDWLNVEKFAELIVDECCLKLLDMDKNTNGIHQYYKHAAIQIKRHFKDEE